MHSYIISGGNATQRTKETEALTKQWQIHPVDILHIENEDGSIGISQIRTFISSLQLKPNQSPLHAGVIPQGELLTISAQQALLKTLEEPPESVRIIINIPNVSLLLPTIVSRCQVVSLANSSVYTDTELDATWETLTKLEKASIGERISICATLGKTKEELSAFLSRAIETLRKHMLMENGAITKHTSLLHKLLTAKKYEATNINLSLYIEHIFIDINDINIV